MATVLADIPLAGIPLDSDQQKAADHNHGTAAVAAAAGSGKTTLLVARAIRLVENGAIPASVVTLAFNRNAQVTLRERLNADPATKGFEQQMASTFHAFAFQTLKLVMPNLNVLGVSAEESARQERSGGSDTPRLTTRDLGKQVWTQMGGDLRGAQRPNIVQGTDLDELLSIEPGIRERLFAAGWPNAYFKSDGSTTAEQKVALRAAIVALGLRDVSQEALEALVEFMPGFRRARTCAKVVDFTDMMLGLGNLIRKGEEKVMTRLRQIQHLQVDEAQDGNELRWFIAQTVANFGGERSVMAVGDLRQSIAGFAGAQPALFRAWWDKANAQFALPNNYRSASAIVAAGNAVAQGEPWNVGGDAIAARTSLGLGSVRVESVGPLGIAVEVATAINAGLSHKDITVLARTRNALETVAFGLRTKGLKVFVRGGGFVWKGADGRSIRAYLDLAEGNVRDLKAAGWALNKPFRYVSGQKLAAWVTRGRLNQQLYREQSYAPARAVIGVFETLAELSWEDRVQQVQDWLLEGLEKDRAENAMAPDSKSDKADLIKSLCEIARVCGSVAALDIAIEAETKLDPKDPDVIELSTIHQSKGDQWQVVYVTGVQEGVFPHIKSTDDESFAEEVRLLYVAVTRPVSTLVVDVKDAKRFAPKLKALEAVAATTTPPPPTATPVPMPAKMPEAAAPAPEPVKVTRVAPALSAQELLEKINSNDAAEEAERLTSEGAKPVAGERYVPVAWAELQELLKPYTFVEDASEARRAAQRVLVATLADGARVLIYTSVPPGQAMARGLGEDSIKVAMLDRTGKPLSRKQPYAARTRNWRITLLNRIMDALHAHPSLAS